MLSIAHYSSQPPCRSGDAHTQTTQVPAKSSSFPPRTSKLTPNSRPITTNFTNPVGPVETQCVQFMVDSARKMNRARAWQDQILCIQSADSSANLCAENNPQLDATLAIAKAVAGSTKKLSHLSICEQRHFRTFERSHDRLLLLQERHKEQEQSEMAEVQLPLKLHEKEQAEAQEEAKRPTPCTYA